MYKKIYGISVNFAYFAYDEIFGYFDGIINDFNNYSKENDLNITLNRVSFTYVNTTTSTNEYSTAIEYLLRSKSTKYDIFTMDTVYSPRFSKYVADLRLYISKELVEKYLQGNVSKNGIFEDKLVVLQLNK
ncbi:hypothetical protein PIROE2DRAFT_9171 [Piromyces sp. E2]|nr:hypothetical protein PIROE2DRAFT_9171 [Piromyces sp. E2]|eukprot:OUM64133.1 hypothetical protein PIROE2DRAFT_9171 [Piromyces sp. E2]